MENNKYFTPEISDFCIGYEYEIIYLKSVWTKESLRIMDAGWFFESYENDAVPIEFRVPYLTKEQIEAEGWEITDEGIDSRGKKILYKNCKKELNIFNLKYYLIFNEIEKSLNIYMRKSLFDDSITSNLYNGQCKDINTFRKIIKLLGI